MKSTKTLKKNFKLMMRSKGSALVVLFAPLLIVIIIGVGFADTTPPALNIGIHTKDSGDLTQRYVNSLNTSENNIIMFDDEARCVSAIKEGLVVSCIVFPENFVLSDEKQNEVSFYVDESRINLVYQLIATLTLSLGGQSTELSQELTTQILAILEKSGSEAKTNLASIIALKASAKAATDANTASRTSLTNLDVEQEDVSFGDSAADISQFSKDFKSLRKEAQDTVVDGEALLSTIPANSSSERDAFESTLQDLKNAINSSNETQAGIDALVSSINSAVESVNKLKTKLDNTRNVKSSVLNNANALSQNLEKITLGLDALKTSQEQVLSEVDSFNLRSADSIVNPITTNIEPVATKNSKITYSFPYLLMLVVLFVGMMLSSTLVFIEKSSRAFFRNFTTPTKSSYFSFMTYLTSMIILIAQSVAIIIIVYYGLNVPAFTNIEMSAIFLFLGMSVFILLGMFIGNLFSTSEAITMSTISLGSVFIFLSNLILPLETLSPVIQQIARFNPYVIVSEGIRKSMLFEARIELLYIDMLILAGYAVGIIILTLIIKKLLGSKYLMGLGSRNNKNVITVPEDHYLVIDEKKRTVRNIPDLISVLNDLTDEEYEKMIKPKNIFSKWLRENLNAKYLAAKIARKKRKKVIQTLEKYIQKR